MGSENPLEAECSSQDVYTGSAGAVGPTTFGPKNLRPRTNKQEEGQPAGREELYLLKLFLTWAHFNLLK